MTNNTPAPKDGQTHTPHSALPWTGKTLAIYRADGVMIGQLGCSNSIYPPDPEQCAANVAFIVEACNAYDTLREANARLREALDEAAMLLRGWRITHEMGRYSNSPINSTRDWLRRIAALAQAGETK
jgi:hypothetical protein